MGVTMGLNPNGFPKPQMTPQPGMGIMAMMASTVPQPAALGGFPAVPGGDPTAGVPVPLSSNLPLTTAGPPTLLSPMNGDKCGFESHHNLGKSTSPSVSLINVAKVSPKLARQDTPLLSGSASEIHQCWRTTVILLDFPYYWTLILGRESVCVRVWLLLVWDFLGQDSCEAWRMSCWYGIYEIHYYHWKKHFLNTVKFDFRGI